ncbi:MAG: hypothetical protein IPL65_14100 [Lewinellaceae bacterium]|nr:hypothetical protein [Lewinellaceae bacterium]
MKKDIKKSANWLVKAFGDLDKELDFSVKSVEHIETVLTEQFEDGQPKPDGLFASGLGGKLFAISSYIGEVVIRNTKATKWVTDDKDPQGEINIKLVSANGTEMFPAHRVMKRLQNGEEDNVYHYTAIAVKNYMNFDGEIPEGFIEEDENEGKPWWKFW